MKDLARRYAEAMRRHPWVTLTIVALLAGALWDLWRRGVIATGVAVYLMYAASIVATDLTVNETEPPLEELPVRRPKLETGLLLGWTAVLFAWLSWRFLWPELAPGLGDLLLKGPGALVILGLLLLAPLGGLFALGYGLRDVGFRLANLRVGLVVVGVFAGTALLLNPGGILWWKVFQERGALGVPILLLSGLVAGCSEEIFRVLAQSRLGALFKNAALGWLLASLLWALLHMPIFLSKFGEPLRWIGLLPIGLVWGYMTYRTRSLLPAILVHSTNLWGLS